MPVPSPLSHRVLLVLPDAALGGGHTMNFRLADQLTQRGWVVDIAFLFDRHSHVEYRNDFPRIRLIYMHADGRLERVLLPLRLAKLARNYNLVLSGLDLAASNYGYVAARLARRPFVSWIHIAFDEHSRSVSRISRSLSLWVYKHTPSLVFPSCGAMSSLERAMGRKPAAAEWHIIDNFCDVSQSDDTSVELPTNIFSRPVVLSIGRLSEQKAYDRLIRIHATLRKSGVEHHLVILGEGPKRADLEGLAAELGVADSVFLPGHMPNPESWLKGATLFALCSLYEGLPLVLIEALQTGTPIAAMNCPAGPDEILDGGEAGILVPPNDEAALAQAIYLLLTNPDLRALYSERGRLKAKIYSSEVVIPHWEALLDSLIGPPHILEVNAPP